MNKLSEEVRGWMGDMPRCEEWADRIEQLEQQLSTCQYELEDLYKPRCKELEQQIAFANKQRERCADDNVELSRQRSQLEQQLADAQNDALLLKQMERQAVADAAEIGRGLIERERENQRLRELVEEWIPDCRRGDLEKALKG